MTRRRITILLLTVSIAITVNFIFGSFVTYKPTVNSTDMQNLYLTRITKFGIEIILLQLICLTLALTDKRHPRK